MSPQRTLAAPSPPPLWGLGPQFLPPQLLLTVPAAQGTSVCSRSPRMRTLSPGGPPPHWGWRGPWRLEQQGRQRREAAKSNQDKWRDMTHMIDLSGPI